jgi:pimeloyl-ACP methyl ester carboxylesterase
MRTQQMANASTRSGYAPVNGLRMYHEIHGEGQPLVLLHGAYMTVELWGTILPTLAESRQVIAPEMQGHGRTADVDRPLTYEQMADDVAALLQHLGIGEADVFGYSMGAGVAVQVAIRHPDVVRRLVAASVAYNSAGMQPELLAMMETITPEAFAGSPWMEAYERVAPRPQDFATLVAKLKQLDTSPQDWPTEDIRSIQAPTLLVAGDSDAVRLEHAVEMFRLLGGGAMGDLHGLPRSRLAVLPATTHVGVLSRADWLVPMIAEFLDAPISEGSAVDLERAA